MPFILDDLALGAATPGLAASGPPGWLVGLASALLSAGAQKAMNGDPMTSVPAAATPQPPQVDFNALVNQARQQDDLSSFELRRNQPQSLY